MKTYKVSFFKSEEKKEAVKGKKEKREKEEYLGFVVIDDHGVGPNLTLTAKAFRQAPPACGHANKTSIVEMRDA